jgi:hypothetical protein
MHLRGECGAVQIAFGVLVGLAVGAGVLVGAGLYAAGVNSGDSIELALDAVPYSDCPAAGSQAGELHRGDRILATARTQSGEWLQVRDPRDLSGRVWVPARFIVPDDTTSDLPVGDCAAVAAAGAPSGEGGPPTTAKGSAPTTAPGTPTTAKGSTPTPASGAPTTAGGAPPSTAAAVVDNAPPKIGAASATPSTVYDSPCNGQAVTAIVGVGVSDVSGVAEVKIAWQIGSSSDTVVASLKGGQYQATLGPFPRPLGVGLPKAVPLTITARDGAGNTTIDKPAPLTVQSCPT